MGGTKHRLKFSADGMDAIRTFLEAKIADFSCAVKRAREMVGILPSDAHVNQLRYNRYALASMQKVLHDLNHMTPIVKDDRNATSGRTCEPDGKERRDIPVVANQVGF